MARVQVDGLTLGYELIGEGDQRWVITPGGRFSKDSAGVRQLAEALAAHGKQVLIWDRPNCGESDVCFDGVSESDMHAHALAGLLRVLNVAPAVLVGGSAGSRVSLVTAAKQPELVCGLATLWISGGVYGLMNLANYYCANSLRMAWTEGMEAVAGLPDWAEVIERNPSNRARFLAQDRKQFIATFERWMSVYYPRPGEVVPGLSAEVASTIKAPTLVYRSGQSDCWHPRATSEALAEMIPEARLVEPPWPDTEWYDGWLRRLDGRQASPWENWPLLAPSLLEWASDVLPAHT
jgi:pimeloyl-ACP methyl ester carboxylesterase